MADCCACGFLDPVDDRGVVRGAGRKPAARDGDVTVPLVRVPAAERESGGVAVSVLGAGEIEKHQMRGLEPADVSELADVIAGRESPSMVAFRLRPIGGADPRVAAVVGQAVYAAGGADRQRRRGALSRAGRGGRTVAGRSALRRPQQPAQLLEGHAAGRRHDLERVGRRHGRSGPASRKESRCCSRSRRAAPARTRRRSSCGSPTCSRSTRGSTRARARLDLPALDLPISRTGVELLSLAALIASRCNRARSAIESDPGVFAEALRGRRARIRLERGGAMSPQALAWTGRAAVSHRRRATRSHEADRWIARAGRRPESLIDRYRNEGGGRRSGARCRSKWRFRRWARRSSWLPN